MHRKRCYITTQHLAHRCKAESCLNVQETWKRSNSPCAITPRNHTLSVCTFCRTANHVSSRVPELSLPAACAGNALLEVTSNRIDQQSSAHSPMDMDLTSCADEIGQESHPETRAFSRSVRCDTCRASSMRMMDMSACHLLYRYCRACLWLGIAQVQKSPPFFCPHAFVHHGFWSNSWHRSPNGHVIRNMFLLCIQ
jgi:hypothetical protein